MEDRARELSEEAIIRIGGWDPKYARVLLIEEDNNFGLVLVDGNGDGAELELEYWLRDADDMWGGAGSSGHGPLNTLPRSQCWNAGPFVAAVGRVEPTAYVSLEYAGRRYSRRATDSGTWGFVHAVDPGRRYDVPRVIAVVLPQGDPCSGCHGPIS